MYGLKTRFGDFFRWLRPFLKASFFGLLTFPLFSVGAEPENHAKKKKSRLMDFNQKSFESQDWFDANSVIRYRVGQNFYFLSYVFWVVNGQDSVVIL